MGHACGGCCSCLKTTERQETTIAQQRKDIEELKRSNTELQTWWMCRKKAAELYVLPPPYSTMAFTCFQIVLNKELEEQFRALKERLGAVEQANAVLRQRIQDRCERCLGSVSCISAKASFPLFCFLFPMLC